MWIPIMAASAASWCIFVALTAGEMIDCARVKKPEDKDFSEARRSDLRQRNVTAPAMIAIVTGLFVGISSTFFHSAVSHGIWSSSMPMEELTLNLLLGVLFALIALTIAPVLANILIKGDGSPSESAKDPFRIYSAAREHLLSNGRGAVELNDLKANLHIWNSKIYNYAMNVESSRNSPILNAALEDGNLKRGVCFMNAAIKVFWAGAAAFYVRFALFWMYLILAVAGIVAILVSQWQAVGDEHWKLIAVAATGLLLNGMTVLIYSIARGGRALKWYSVYVSSVDEARDEIERAEESVNPFIGDHGYCENLERAITQLTESVDSLVVNTVNYSLRPWEPRTKDIDLGGASQRR